MNSSENIQLHFGHHQHLWNSKKLEGIKKVKFDFACINIDKLSISLYFNCVENEIFWKHYNTSWIIKNFVQHQALLNMISWVRLVVAWKRLVVVWITTLHHCTWSVFIHFHLHSFNFIYIRLFLISKVYN